MKTPLPNGTSDLNNLEGISIAAYDDFTVAAAVCPDEVLALDEAATLICLAGLVVNINEGGSEIPFEIFDPGFNKGLTEPKKAKNFADIEEWDNVLSP